MINEILVAAWNKRKELITKGDKLRDEGYRRCLEGSKLRLDSDEFQSGTDKSCAKGFKLLAQGNKLWNEGNKLHSEGADLCSEGDLIFINAVIEVYGPDIDVTWTEKSCKLSTGEVFN